METMTTQYWRVDPVKPQPEIVFKAADIIKQGGLVAFPTETVYGLGANGLDSKSVAGIYLAKGRPSDNPLILHVSRLEQVDKLSSGLPGVALDLMDIFWPGPLTLVVPRAKGVPDAVTGGLNTVAVRMPDHPVALALIEAAGVPVAAPSANRSGRPSPTLAEHVRLDLEGKIDAVLDGGPAGMGVESTVLDITGEIPVILRPGGVTLEQLRQVLGEVKIDPAALGEKLTANTPVKSPGMKYMHYAPSAPLVLFEGEPGLTCRAITQQAEEEMAQGKRVCILASKENAQLYPGEAVILELGSRDKPASAARRLFRHLRECDRLRVDVILVEGLAPQGIGLAVMNRLRRAAQIITRCEA